MIKKTICILILIILFAVQALFCGTQKRESVIKSVISPSEFTLESGENIKISGFDFFNPDFGSKNKTYAEKFGITESEAFILGNLAKYYSENLLLNRRVKIENEDIIFYKFSYKSKFENTPFCIKDGKLTNEEAFKRQLKSVRRGKFMIFDLDTNEYFEPDLKNFEAHKNYVVIRKSLCRKISKSILPEIKERSMPSNVRRVIKSGNIKIILSDHTSKLKPDRNCETDICREILNGINSTKTSLDMAIYGYSSTPEIEKAVKSAIKRGVKVRLVYDLDTKGKNIYPDTADFVKLIAEKNSDEFSTEAGYTMHNKFYIFDNKRVITGSANLSHTDMSGYNSNNIIIIDSAKTADIYRREFEQMLAGKFHGAKTSDGGRQAENMKIYFSPQDKPISNGIIPLIRNAKNYIYIPTFVITQRELTQELINARRRGVDVKIILDALNASSRHTKHKELRQGGIPVKTENYAGKMHSKAMIIDDEYLILGSMNFSYSGESRNDENMIVLKNRETAEFYRDFFLYQWSKIPDKWLKYNARAEGKDSVGSCTDGIDNNYDGLTDSADMGCK